MRLIILFLLLSAFSLPGYSNSKINIIPAPQQINMKNGNFILNGNTKIVSDRELDGSGVFLKNMLKSGNGLDLDIVLKGKSNVIQFNLDVKLEKELGTEGYELFISKKEVQISAATETGIFYGIQSLFQIISNQSSEIIGASNQISIPCVEIKDYPRFKWRAYLLDEARYFHGEEFVKMILDQMSLLKMNVFQWHLTDDAGWRIEIKKYPKLTEVGGFRKNSQVGIKKWKSEELSGKPHGGFYTQEQIKDIVAYAAERQITVVPEIEMPGHSSAAVAAYPWVGTEKIPVEVPVTFGKKRHNYDVTDEKVIGFIHDVLNEVFLLFPSQVIHIGGDEVDYASWRESDHVQAFMKEKGLKIPADLQIYFTNNISKFIENNGRRMMGWNEILGVNIHQDADVKKDDKDAETELAKNTIIHFWKGSLELATDAVEKGYSIVNSLHSETYLDYSYQSIPLQKAYNYNPIPEGLDKKYHKNIYGLGTQMWTEWTPTQKETEFQTFPRIAAYAEVGWTNLVNKDYSNFSETLKYLKKRWRKEGINFAEVE